jgi:hypothetical protein
VAARLGAAACALLMAGTAARAQDAALPVENLRLPLEHYPSGIVKREILAGVARVPPKGAIRAERVRVVSYDEAGRVDMEIAADTCVYDREKGTAGSDKPVRVSGQGVVIMGQGFEWDGEKQVVKILSRARVEFNRNVKELKGTRHGR